MKLAWILLLSAACPAAVAEEGACAPRSGLPNACRIWTHEQEGSVFYIGTAAGNAPGGTRDQLPRIVKKVIPGAKGVRAFCAWNRAYPDNCSSIIETFRSMSSSAAVSGEGFTRSYAHGDRPRGGRHRDAGAAGPGCGRDDLQDAQAEPGARHGDAASAG